ncbi:AraC family transcriptional regulator [Paenibacillus allorhizosphaerae]|uniref:Arabinose operon regulatory protein n=1 Tax=Paenibacillus allorhizosphaerae TaxID=2849866 RepID=A0ABM8VJC0_9BACL|nr:AraC family transcriptional regulator [Paenibacillus allorhizosphaerae]CAG7645250.1 Arabinose operon regulatory protein [Paenibacillus allorhizosphaerae]
MFPKNYSVTLNPRPDIGDLTVLFAGHQRTKPTHTVGPRVHEYYLLHYVVSGSGELYCSGRTHKIEAGDCFFIFPGEKVVYSADPANPWFYRWVGFKGHLADILLKKISVSSERPVVRAEQRRRTAAFLYRIQTVLNQGLRGCDLESSGLLRILLSQWLLEEATEKQMLSAEADQKVEQAVRWLSLQYSQPVSIERLAQSLGYHRTYFSKIFKRRTGLTPAAFLHNIRMEHAQILLSRMLTVEEVAYSVGYTDALFFSKQFKKWSGRTPSDYRSSRK